LNQNGKLRRGIKALLSFSLVLIVFSLDRSHLFTIRDGKRTCGKDNTGGKDTDDMTCGRFGQAHNGLSSVEVV